MGDKKIEELKTSLKKDLEVDVQAMGIKLKTELTIELTTVMDERFEYFKE